MADRPRKKSQTQQKQQQQVDEPIVVRATINLPDLPAGHTATVHPDDPYIKDLLAASYLTRESPPPDPEPSSTPGNPDADHH